MLKTGIVRKQKKIEPDVSFILISVLPSMLRNQINLIISISNLFQIDKQDAWSRYMAEVNQYKQRSCTDDDKTRPLVK